MSTSPFGSVSARLATAENGASSATVIPAPTMAMVVWTRIRTCRPCAPGRRGRTGPRPAAGPAGRAAGSPGSHQRCANRSARWSLLASVTRLRLGAEFGRLLAFCREAFREDFPRDRVAEMGEAPQLVRVELAVLLVLPCRVVEHVDILVVVVRLFAALDGECLDLRVAERKVVHDAGVCSSDDQHVPSLLVDGTHRLAERLVSHPRGDRPPEKPEDDDVRRDLEEFDDVHASTLPSTMGSVSSPSLR